MKNKVYVMLHTKGTVNMANIKDAVYLIDDDSFGMWGNLRTSWDYVNDGEGTCLGFISEILAY